MGQILQRNFRVFDLHDDVKVCKIANLLQFGRELLCLRPIWIKARNYCRYHIAIICRVPPLRQCLLQLLPFSCNHITELESYNLLRCKLQIFQSLPPAQKLEVVLILDVSEISGKYHLFLVVCDLIDCVGLLLAFGFDQLNKHLLLYGLEILLQDLHPSNTVGIVILDLALNSSNTRIVEFNSLKKQLRLGIFLKKQ